MNVMGTAGRRIEVQVIGEFDLHSKLMVIIHHKIMYALVTISQIIQFIWELFYKFERNN